MRAKQIAYTAGIAALVYLVMQRYQQHPAAKSVLRAA